VSKAAINKANVTIAEMVRPDNVIVVPMHPVSVRVEKQAEDANPDMIETAAFPVDNFLAGLELIPVTNTDQTFVQWWATFDEQPEDSGKFVEIVSRDVLAAGLKSLAEKTRGLAPPDDAERWQGLRPANVFTSSVIGGPVDAVWARIRDFAEMGGWHDDITQMRMEDGVQSDKISGVRDFLFGDRTQVRPSGNS